MQTIIIGHKNPDMDSVCAAAAYAVLKRALGVPGVVAARAGNLNPRIQFVFDKFGLEPPVHVTDVTPQVRDVMTAPAISVRADSTIAEAISSIEEKRLRDLPVVDEADHCLGLLSALKVIQKFFPPRPDVENARVVRATLSDIVRTFEGTIVAGGGGGDLRDYFLLVAAMKETSFAARLERYPAARVVVFAGDRDGIQRRAIERRVNAIVSTGRVPFSKEIQQAAEKAGVTLIRSRYDTATTVLQARGAVRVNQMTEREFISFSPETPLAAARAKAADAPGSLFPILDAERRLVGVLSKSDCLKTIPRQLILVDHNELTQAVHGADKLPIIEILDHHRLGGFSTDSPIHFWNNPVGSTSTIVAQLFAQHGEPIPPPIAGLLMAGLISDTLNLTSPTATPTDRTILRRLEGVTGLDATQLAAEIFAVGSPLRTLSAAEAVASDCKEYEEAGIDFSVAQIEELSFVPFNEKQAELSEALAAYCQGRRLYFSALLVTDINTQNSLLLVAGAEAFRRAIDYPSVGKDVWQLDGVVSRKKQLLPYLLHRLQEARMSSAR